MLKLKHIIYKVKISKSQSYDPAEIQKSTYAPKKAEVRFQRIKNRKSRKNTQKIDKQISGKETKAKLI